MAAATLAAVSLVSSGVQAYQGRKAAKVQKQANATQRAQAEARANRARRKQARQAAIARGQQLNQAGQTGTMGSSGVMGGMQNVSNQLQGNLGQINADRESGNIISGLNQKAADYQSRGSIFGGISSMAGTLAGKEGFRALGQTIFSPNAKPDTILQQTKKGAMIGDFNQGNSPYTA